MSALVKLHRGVDRRCECLIWAVSDALRGYFANYVVWKRPCRLNWVPEGLRAIEVCVIVGRLRN